MGLCNLALHIVEPLLFSQTDKQTKKKRSLWSYYSRRIFLCLIAFIYCILKSVVPILHKAHCNTTRKQLTFVTTVF